MSKFSGTKYRHIVGTVQKKELWYPDLKPTTGGGEATTIAASAQWIAVAWSSAGSVALLDLDQPGKRSKIDLPMIFGHSTEISDLAFSPFRDDMLATAAEDSTIKIWKIPEKNTANLNTPEVSLQSHKRRADSIKWNPVAPLLASGSSDKTLKIWDIEAGKDVISLDGIHTDVIHSIDWNYTGNLIVTICKDKKLRIIDPRANSVVQTGEAHQGVKATRVCWLGETNKIATTGFSKFRERQFGMWDSKDLSKALAMPTLDSSTGIIDLAYDNDARILVLAGKGDGNLKLYEMADNAPFYTELSNVQSDVAQKSTCIIPKRAVDLMNTEILRVLKLTTNAVATVSYSVPRKTKSEFQEDLYPPTNSTQPALSSSQWFAGENGTPIKFQLKPNSNPHKFWEDETKAEAPKSEPAPVQKPVESPKVEVKSPAPVASQTPVAAAKMPEEKKETSSPRSSVNLSQTSSPGEKYVPKVVKVVRSSKFRHIAGKGTKMEECYTNLKVNTAANNSVIRANRTFFCVPWQGSGGLIAIMPLKKTGRTSDKIPFIETGSACLDFDFNPFNDHLFATTTESAYVQIWKIPEGGLTSVMKDPAILLKGHLRRVTSVDYHPTVSNLVVTGSGDNTIRIWDLEKGAEAIKLDGPSDTLQSVTWNWNGSQMAASGKDRELKLYDPRSGTITAKTVAHEGAKGFKATWLGQKDKIASVGYSKTSERQMSLWDIRNLSSALGTVSIDHGAGMITPYYDADIGVMYLAGKGDGNIKMYEIEDEAPYMHFLTEHGSSIPAQGIAMLPKVACNVKECEIARFIKLASDYAEPLSFKVPRTRMEYFQDDLYPPTKKVEPTLSAAEWLEGKNLDPEVFSLQPEGMKPLSEAPVEQKTKKYEFNPVVEDKRDAKEKVLDRWNQQVGALQEKDNTVLKQDLMEGADDSEWD